MTTNQKIMVTVIGSFLAAIAWTVATLGVAHSIAEWGLR